MIADTPSWAGAKLAIVRRTVTDRLHDAGIKEAPIEARHMLDALFNTEASGHWLDPDQSLDNAQAAQLEAMCARREAREPLSHILSEWGFWSLDLKVSKDVLTPRPETERLVEIALETLGPKPAHILDLGTGSGAILLALLAECPNTKGVGVDLSPAALAVARANAENLKLDDRAEFIQGNWDSALAYAPFDLVVSNPPYIVSDVIETLEPEVRQFEPMLALDGGADGLDAYRALLPLMAHYLKPGARFIFEIGADQGDAVMDLAQGHDFLNKISLFADLAGRDRVFCATHC